MKRDLIVVNQLRPSLLKSNNTVTSLALRPAAMLVVWAFCFTALPTLESRSEEPYEKFLQRLRDQQLYELALVYLDDLSSKSNMEAEFKADIQLERGLLLYQAAAVLPPTNAERPRKLDDAETALQDFLSTKKQHPRRGEARMKLGELLLTRAEEAKTRGVEDPKQDNVEAIKFYDDAQQLFESTITELAEILEKLKGARVDASDTAQVAYRQKVQQDLRQSQLLSAKSVEDRGRSRAEGSSQRTADLQLALTMFNDLYSKEQRMVGIRNYSLFYRSAIQATLGKTDDAIDGFQRVADLEGVDILRPLQTKATTELVMLLAAQKKYALAVDRAKQWLDALRPDERATAETLALKIELAKQQIAWSNELKAKDPNDRVASRLIRDTRSDLRSLLKTPGAHLEAAREMLGQLGVEETEAASSEIPKVKDFAEALAAAQERIDRSETDSIGLETYKLELADPNITDEKKQAVGKTLSSMQEKVDTDQRQAIELLRTGLRLFQASDDRESLFDARFRLAFLLLKQQKPWDAMAVAEFLSRSAAGTDKGLRAAAITLGSFSDLLRVAGPAAKAELTDQLQPFAEYLVKTWPTSAEASAASAALVQLALINKDFNKAQEFIALIPAGGGAATSKLRRDAGLAFYAKYLEEKKSAGEDAESTQQLRAESIGLLQAGAEALTQDSLEAGAMEAVNVLTRLLLSDKKLDEAKQIMLDGASSPLKKLAADSAGIATRVVMDTYRTAIQLKIALLAEDKIAADQAVLEVKETIRRLQALATDAASSTTLTSIFVSLASDLNEQLSATKEEQKRKKIAETLLIVTVEAAKTDQFNTQYWAADTIVSIAEELSKTPMSKGQATSAYGEAAKILDAILAKEQSQPGWINPPGLSTQIRLKRAQASRGLGDFKEAIEQLYAILSKSSGLLDVQIEAARTYEAWGAAVNSGFYRVAIEGGRPDPRSRRNVIWGWGEIQKRTANQKDYTEQFFLARYQLAFSRMQYAKGLKEATQKTEELKRAEYDITSTAKMYPDLGGPVMKKRFEALLSTLQKQQ